MAFKGYGVGDFVTVKQGVEVSRVPGTVNRNSGRGRVTVDGVEFTPKRRLYPGVPTPAMLKANNIVLHTMKCRPWPGSAADRLSKSAPDSIDKVDKNGDTIRMAGPSSMLDMEKPGLWPDEEERQLQAQAEAKLAHPVAYGERALIAQGVSPEKAKHLATAHGQRHQMLDVSDLLPKAPATPTVDAA